MERLGRFSILLSDWFQQMSTNLKTHLSAKLSGAVPVLCETVYEGFLNVMAEYDTGPGKGLMSRPTHVIRIFFATPGIHVPPGPQTARCEIFGFSLVLSFFSGAARYLGPTGSGPWIPALHCTSSFGL